MEKCTLTISLAIPGFYVSGNTVGKKEIARKSNFSFSKCVFYQFGKLSAIFIKFEIVVCKLSKFARVFNLSFWKRLRIHCGKRSNCFSQVIAFNSHYVFRVPKGKHGYVSNF